jgi:hypothetical protein
MKPFILLLSLVAVVAFVAAACGGDDDESEPTARPSDTAAATTAAAADEMQLPPGAEDMKIEIVSPANGTEVTENSLALQVEATGFDLACDLAGKPNQDGKGHYHVLIDKALVNMYCTNDVQLSMQNLEPGMHTIAVVPALNDHAEVLDNETEVEFDYQPTTPLAAIADVTGLGEPSIKVLEPKPGATVSGEFDVVIEVSNFNLSCDLLGKPDVAGYGHWHLNLDTTTGPMMGMATMVGMSCEQTFRMSTAGLTPGSTHSIIPLLTDNQHVPLMPEVSDAVDVIIQ